MKKVSHISIGKIGEDLAASYLLEKDFTILGRNWKCRMGEIDIVAWDGEVLVVVEVKTRIDSQFGRTHLFDNLHSAKQKRLRRLSQLFTAQMCPTPKYSRIDVIGVLLAGVSLEQGNRAHASEIQHLVAAF